MATPQRPQRPQRTQNQGQMNTNSNSQRVQRPQNQQGFNSQESLFGNMDGDNFFGGEQVQQNVQTKKKSPLKIILIILGIVVFLVGEGVLAYFVATGRIDQRIPELEAEIANWEEKYDNLNSSKNSEIKKLPLK